MPVWEEPPSRTAIAGSGQGSRHGEASGQRSSQHWDVVEGHYNNISMFTRGKPVRSFDSLFFKGHLIMT